MGISFKLNDEGITFWQDGIILFDCPIARIEHDPKNALIAMKLMMEMINNNDLETYIETIEKYEKALKFIVNVDGWFIGKDLKFDNEIALDLIDKTARKALEV